jgi:hypothetical protein
VTAIVNIAAVVIYLIFLSVGYAINDITGVAWASMFFGFVASIFCIGVALYV